MHVWKRVHRSFISVQSSPVIIGRTQLLFLPRQKCRVRVVDILDDFWNSNYYGWKLKNKSCPKSDHGPYSRLCITQSRVLFDSIETVIIRNYILRKYEYVFECLCAAIMFIVFRHKSLKYFNTNVMTEF